MAKNLEISYLLDFYSEMLTQKQREVIEYYYNDDLSLSEIAMNEGITRQGVRDSIKRAETQLLEMEERLGLCKRFREMQEGLDVIIEAAQDLGANSRKVFLKVTVPMSMPGIISGITMVFVPAVSTFIISKMLGGGSNLLIGDLIDMQFLGNAYNPYLGSAISLVLMVLILICMGIMNQFDEDGSAEGGMMP